MRFTGKQKTAGALFLGYILAVAFDPILTVVRLNIENWAAENGYDKVYNWPLANHLWALVVTFWEAFTGSWGLGLICGLLLVSFWDTGRRLVLRLLSAVGVRRRSQVTSSAGYGVPGDTMELVVGRSFVDEEVVVDGRRFEECKFVNCRFRSDKALGFHFSATNRFFGDSQVGSASEEVKQYLALVASISSLRGGALTFDLDKLKPEKPVAVTVLDADGGTIEDIDVSGDAHGVVTGKSRDLHVRRVTRKD
jgi:hypothetical protein